MAELDYREDCRQDRRRGVQDRRAIRMKGACDHTRIRLAFLLKTSINVY